MLIVLDDAAGHEQVRPLLPGSPGSLVVITSRRRLAALEDVESLTLDMLPPAKATELLRRLIRDHVADADSEAAAELVRLCGYLPLAIGLMAGRLRSHPSWTVRHLSDRLRATQDLLAELHVEGSAVEAAFQLSYRELSTERQHLFRRLGLHPGREFDAYAAARLDGSDVVRARQGLEALYDHHLIDEPGTGRYRMHDLIRSYSRILALRDDVESNHIALDRLLDYYLHVTAEATRRVAGRGTTRSTPVAHVPAEVPVVSGRSDALAWLDAERSNLIAAFDHAAMQGQHDRVVALARWLNPFLFFSGHWDQAVAVQEAALTVARLTGDRLGQANSLGNLGIVRYETGESVAATDTLKEALSLYRDLGDLNGQANTLIDLGTVQRMTGQYRAAMSSLTEALTIYHDVRDRNGHAYTLTSVGIVQYLTGDYAAAASGLAEAVSIFRDIGNRNGLTYALVNLGLAQHLIGEYLAATATLTEALDLSSIVGDRLRQAGSLNHLGLVQQRTGAVEAAARSFNEALQVFRDHGNPLGEATVLNDLGRLLLDTSGHTEALGHHRRALQIAQEIHSPLEEARAMEGIGRCLIRARHVARGADHLRSALAIYRRLGVPQADQIVVTLDDLEPPGEPDERSLP